jgi:pilus assembly protein CpaB
MSFRTGVIVLLAVVFGVTAAAGVNMLRSAPTRTDVVPVVVAAADIPRYTTITADLLKVRDFPRDFVPSGAISRAEDLLDRVADTPMFRDEPIVATKLSAKGTGRGMAAVIPPGMRAVTIQTPNVAAGVAGFILPGNKVDVLLTVRGIGSGNIDPTGGGSTTTLLQNVELLAVDQRVDAPSGNKMDTKELRSVTLLVTPDQAAQLDLGQNLGTLHLSLRNPQDKTPASTRVATLADLRFTQGTVPAWSESLKSVFETAAKLAAEQRAAQERAAKERAEREEKARADRERVAAAKAEQEKAEQEKKARLAIPTIRTLRGTVEGKVTLE